MTHLDQLTAALDHEGLIHSESVLDIFGDQGPLDPNHTQSPIDGDEGIDALLAKWDL